MKYWLMCSMIFLLAACSNPKKEVKKTFNEDKFSEPLVKANQNAVRLEDEDIDLYIKRQQMNVVKTETGLRYQITKKNNGRKIKAEDIVTLDFKTFSINGELLYSSDESGRKVMEVEKNNEIQALDEVLKQMSNGEEAHLVIPSHLAFGIAGDGDKIRQRIPIVMKIKVLSVKNKK